MNRYLLGADGIRHRTLCGVVRGIHGELRARDAAARRALRRAAQPQDARRLATGTNTHTHTHKLNERRSCSCRHLNFGVRVDVNTKSALRVEVDKGTR